MKEISHGMAVEIAKMIKDNISILAYADQYFITEVVFDIMKQYKEDKHSV